MSIQIGTGHTTSTGFGYSLIPRPSSLNSKLVTYTWYMLCITYISMIDTKNHMAVVNNIVIRLSRVHVDKTNSDKVSMSVGRGYCTAMSQLMLNSEHWSLGSHPCCSHNINSSKWLWSLVALHHIIIHFYLDFWTYSNVHLFECELTSVVEFTNSIEWFTV